MPKAPASHRCYSTRPTVYYRPKRKNRQWWVRPTAEIEIQIVDFIAEHGSSTVTELATVVGKRREVVGNYVRALIHAGTLIRASERSRRIIIAPLDD